MSEQSEAAYSTRDFAEAVTLATCGVPFFYPDQRMVHMYRAARLKEIGMTARQAVEQNIEGEKTWMFKKTPECDTVVAAFAKAWAGPKSQIQTLPNIDIGDLALGIATALRNRKELAGDWKYVTPHVAIERPDGSVTIITEHTPKDVLDRWGIKI